MGFKENLKDEMAFQDIKPKELSDKTGISVNTIRNYINGHNALPSVDSGVKIARALGVSVEYLVDGKSEKNETPEHSEKLIQDFRILDENDKKSVLALIAEMKKHYLK